MLRRLRRRDLARRSARALVAVGLAFMVLVPAALGGVRFAWCIPMARAQLHCCCHAEQAHRAHADAAATRGSDARAPRVRNTCCEGREVTALPASPSAPPAAAAVLPAAYVAYVTLEALHAPAASPVAAFALEHARLPRAGPEPPLFALNQSYLN